MEVETNVIFLFCPKIRFEMNKTGILLSTTQDCATRRPAPAKNKTEAPSHDALEPPYTVGYFRKDYINPKYGVVLRDHRGMYDATYIAVHAGRNCPVERYFFSVVDFFIVRLHSPKASYIPFRTILWVKSIILWTGCKSVRL